MTSLFYFLLVTEMSAQEKVNDTINSYWKNSVDVDSLKLEKIHKMIWKNVLFSNPEKAFGLAQKHYELAQQTHNLKHQASALNTQGVSYGLRSEYNNAIKYYTQSISIRKEIGDLRGVANTLSNIGLSLKDQGDYIGAIKNYTESLKIHERIHEFKGQATALNNIGVIYQDQKNYIKSIEYFEKSLALYKKSNNDQGKTLALTNIGLSYSNLKKYDKAKKVFEQSLALHQKLKDKDGLARCLGFMSEVFYSEKNYEEAMKFQQKSLEIRQEIDDKSGVSECFNYMAEIAYVKGEYAKALRFGNRSLIEAQNINNIKLLLNAYSILYKTNRVLKKYNTSLHMYEAYIMARDSIRSEANHREIVKQELTYKFEKQKAIDDIEAKRKISIAEKEKENTNIKFIALSIFMVLITIFLFILYKRYRVTKGQKKTIEIQFKEIQDKTERIIEIEKEKHEQELFLKRKDLESVVANNKMQVKLKENLISSLRNAQQSENLANEIKNIVIDLNLEVGTQQKIGMLEANVEDVNAHFFFKLLEKHSDISKTEKEICSYIKLGLSTKEIAAIRNTSTNTINVTKTRLRKKLGLTTNSEIQQYLLKI